MRIVILCLSVLFIHVVTTLRSRDSEYLNLSKIGIEMMGFSWVTRYINLTNPIRTENDHFVCYNNDEDTIPYSYKDRKDNSTYSQIYNHMLRIIFYNACVNNSVSTTNHKTPFSNEAELEMISLLDEYHQSDLKKIKDEINKALSYKKTSNVLEYLQMLFPRHRAMIENMPNPALKTLRYTRIIPHSCDVENMTYHRDCCFHEDLLQDLKREVEERREKYKDWWKPTVTTTTTPHSINKDDIKDDKKKKPICRQTLENDVFYHFSCENASKMLVHSCVQKVTNGDMIKLINETGCPVDKDRGVMKYFGDTMAKAFFDGNTDVQCSFTTCQKDEDCQIKSPPHCREPHTVWTEWDRITQ